VGARFALEGELARKMGQLMVTMEAYPQLKSDTTVLEAQRTWTEVEAQITAARRFYNAAVNRLNNAIQIFPGSLLAALAGVSTMPFFEAEPEARVAPSMDALMPPAPRAQP
jgi:LemA protein